MSTTSTTGQGAFAPAEDAKKEMICNGASLHIQSDFLGSSIISLPDESDLEVKLWLTREPSLEICLPDNYEYAEVSIRTDKKIPLSWREEIEVTAMSGFRWLLRECSQELKAARTPFGYFEEKE